MKKKKSIIIIIIIAIIIASAIFYWTYQKNQNKLTWRTNPVVTRTVTTVITATGTINPVILVNVGTEVSGRIEQIYKDFNDTVRKGELLARLDASTLQMALEDARIEFRKSQLTLNENLLDLNRAQELFDQNMIAGFDLDKAKFNHEVALENLERARFAVQRAETNFNNTMIYSPIDGVIVSRAVDEGQTVAASFNAPTLFLIANNLDEMQIEAQIDETDIGKVSVGQRSRFTIDAFPDMRFSGEVRQVRLNPIVESNVVTYKVIIAISNPNNIIMPGMSANLEIIIDQRENVLVIPERALQFRPSKEVWEAFSLKWDDSLAGTARGRTRQQIGATQNNANIWILEDGLPKQITIETGISDGNFMHVISGIGLDTEVITGVNHPIMQAQSGGAAFGGGQRMMMVR